MGPRRAVWLTLFAATGCFVDYPPGLSGTGDSASEDGSSTAVETTGTSGTSGEETTSSGDGGLEGCPTTTPPGTWFIDQDGDSWGDGPGQVACDRPPGTAPMLGDCDDDDPERYPGALEVCDGEDDDCDEILDEFSPANATCDGCRLTERDGAPHWFCKVEGIDWVAARKACIARGWTVELLSIHGEDDHTWARAQAEALYEGGIPGGTFWIGLRRSDPHWQACEPGTDQWEWSDGSPVDFAAWSMGQPDSWGMSCDPTCVPTDALDAACPRENCGQMLYTDGGWNDRSCYTKGVGYACRAAVPP